MAIDEDLAGGVDITSEATIGADQVGVAEYRLREGGVIAGIPIAVAVLQRLGITEIHAPVTCAHFNEPGTVILTAKGNVRSLLLAERTTLNFLSHLSGISTFTRTWVDEIAESTCQVKIGRAHV